MLRFIFVLTENIAGQYNDIVKVTENFQNLQVSKNAMIQESQIKVPKS